MNPPPNNRLRRGIFITFVVALALIAAQIGSAHHAGESFPSTPLASNWNVFRFPTGQPACTGVGYAGAVYYDRRDCSFGYVSVSETTTASVVRVQVLAEDDTILDDQLTTYRSADDAWQFNLTPGSAALNPPAWDPGVLRLRVSHVDGADGNFGETTFFLNQLRGTLATTAADYSPGDSVTVTGVISEVDQVPPLAGDQLTPVGATFEIQVVTPEGDVRGPYGPFTANALDGTYTAVLPAAATAGITATAQTNYQKTLSAEIINATYTDPVTEEWAADRAGSGGITVVVPASELTLNNSFISSVGWVKPGDTYPFRVVVRNDTGAPATNISVTLPNVASTTFTQVAPSSGTTAVINTTGTDTAIDWNVGTLADGAIATLVVEGQAHTLGQDPEVVWKDLSSTANLSYDQGSNLVSETHGPRVIPVDARYDSARYGDRPFPVVPVDFFDRKHENTNTGTLLANKINSPSIPGSTFNLFQEMSLGQLFPNGTVPSVGIASADFTVDWQGYYNPNDDQFFFTDLAPQGTCAGNTYKELVDSPAYGERIVNGWYQMPGDTGYYGTDRYSVATLGGAVAGVGLLLAIDDACGPTGKAVYDAAHIADPEIDYNDYDTDKDGVVDFFMMVFVGVGGNGESQLNAPPYDNIWPHSSSLEFYYTDAATGLNGYISDDQLRSLTGVPQCWLDSSYSNSDDCTANGGTGDDSLPVYVRVGPYNVNPESAIENASVISHEYGHSLGLPDFYSLGNRETYGDWNLMATDKSHHMDIFSKQEMGWIVPQWISATQSVTGWGDSKIDTGEIHWQRPDGTPYTLSAANGDQNIHNADAYMVKLPPRILIDPAKVIAGASPDHVWWSGAGNDFGCPPSGGHNFDVFLPELASVTPGSTITVTFNSYFDIEWDYDYGFVLYSNDDGASYTSLPSEMGYTTATSNPNTNACQGLYGNGLTGTSGSYEAGTDATDRLLGNYPDGPFLPDQYDLSAAAGSATILRFSYATDPGLARPGWFIDDLTIWVDGAPLLDDDFEEENDLRYFNGGCNAHGAVAQTCTPGWTYVSAADGSPADHAYYLEMRDRSGFDLDGKDENDRDPIGFAPGLLLVYTDESHGYGNTGADNQPAQSPLDAVPQPGEIAPNLDDAAFNFNQSYSDAGAGHTDNYDDGSGSWVFAYDCLDFTVDAMTGDTNGPLNPPYDLFGDVTFTIGTGCSNFDYGLGMLVNSAPTAVAQVRNTSVQINKPVTFDGSGSYDDITPTGTLTYTWDFGDGAARAVMTTAMGQVVTHTYPLPGDYTVTLTVEDEGGLTNQDQININVSASPTAVTLSDPTTEADGASVPFALLFTLVPFTLLFILAQRRRSV